MKSLTAKTGLLDRDKADAFLAREIKFTWFALAAFLDYFHPQPIQYFSGLERLVRYLVVIEASLERQ